jgi:LacI family transcriptional regulator
MGYRVNAPARSIVKGRTCTLGAILPDVENVFFARVLRGIADVGRAERFEVLVANTDDRVETETAALDLFLRNCIDGVIWLRPRPPGWSTSPRRDGQGYRSSLSGSRP